MAAVLGVATLSRKHRAAHRPRSVPRSQPVRQRRLSRSRASGSISGQAAVTWTARRSALLPRCLQPWAAPKNLKAHGDRLRSRRQPPGPVAALAPCSRRVATPKLDFVIRGIDSGADALGLRASPGRCAQGGQVGDIYHRFCRVAKASPFATIPVAYARQ